VFNAHLVLTAFTEVLAELTNKPLLKVNLGRIAAQRNWEQSLEQIFLNAETWKAILLIDEAEVVLEKRTFERMTSSPWIAGMLTSNKDRNRSHF
jgi:hypothetical protein